MGRIKLLFLTLLLLTIATISSANDLIPNSLTLETMNNRYGCTKDPLPMYISRMSLPQLSGQSEEAGCTKDTTTLVYEETTATSGANKTTNIAIGQSFSYGSAWTLHSIDIWHNSSSTCTEDIRIGTAQNLATYDEEWASHVFPDTEGWENIESAVNPSYDADELVYFAGMELSGACKWDYDADNPNATGTYLYANSTDWDLDTSIGTRDFTLKVYKCQ